jgi:hypothetical protein
VFHGEVDENGNWARSVLAGGTLVVVLGGVVVVLGGVVVVLGGVVVVLGGVVVVVLGGVVVVVPGPGFCRCLLMEAVVFAVSTSVAPSAMATA